MSPRPTLVDERMAAYLATVGSREPAVLARLRAATDRLEQGSMRSAVEQVALLAFLVEATAARRVLEIGVFTGYGTLGMALALPADGKVLALEADPAGPAVGRPFWQEAGVADRIDLRLGLAADTLATLLRDPGPASFDLAYVDADKKSYPLYYESALELLRPGGIVAIDNVLWHGAVADSGDQDRQTRTLRDLNAAIHADRRVSMVLLPIGDGLTLCRKR